MADCDETEDSVAFALPDCEILCAICNQSAHLDIKRTQQIYATWMIQPQDHTTMTNDCNLDTLTNLDANIAHRIWLLPRREAHLKWKNIQIKVLKTKIFLLGLNLKLIYRQLRRIWMRQTTESIRNAGQISMANVSRSGLSQRKQRKKVIKPVWQMLVQSWATPAAATLLWHNILVKRCDGSRRIACQTGNRDNGIVQNNIPRVPCV